MDKALYLAANGAKNAMFSQQAHANNLANVNTTGFKEDYAQARSMPVFGDVYPSRAYAMSERPATNFEQGPLMQTGNNLDVALTGAGWIAVQTADGEEAYTRAGDMQIDVNGMLRTGAGFPVLGNGGPIAVPPASAVEIGADGTISIIPLGNNGVDLAQIDRIRLVNPEADTIEKQEDGLIHVKPGNELPAPDPNVRLEVGFLEGSNVSAVEELTEFLALSRQFELQVKIMQEVESNNEASARLLQIS